MNGAVFQVSAITTASQAWKPSVVHRMFARRRSLATPSAEKIHRHSSADMAVGMAQGTRMLARTRPRPRKALFITSAMQTPMVVSMMTVTMVNVVVFQNALRNAAAVSPRKMSM